ncbi:MAG: hypothetical protein JSV96_14665 [Candidatus Aminicenantes bacterium]|nr:MAG: hypothetical protein JSV96_14665 [Candidatus Aminicenantes bacterium]
MIGKKVLLGILVFGLTTIFINSLYSAEIMPQDRKKAALILDRDISGKIFLYDWNNFLMVQINKAYGKKIELLQKEGEYKIVYVVEGDIRELEIALRKGERLELNASSFAATDHKFAAPQKEKISEERRMTILRGKTSYRFFAEIVTKTTSIHGETAVLMGGNFGFTINRTFSIGVGGYGKANFDPGLPGYGGITFAYVFSPLKEVHFRATALAGSGTARCGGIFYIFEPGVEVVLNLSRVVRIQAGVSLPIVDKEFSDLENLMLCVGFQFGK